MECVLNVRQAADIGPKTDVAAIQSFGWRGRSPFEMKDYNLKGRLSKYSRGETFLLLLPFPGQMSFSFLGCDDLRSDADGDLFRGFRPDI